MKADWSKSSEQKIKKHDESVRQNWNKLKGGELNDLPQDLIAHIKKFTSRQFHVSEMPPKTDKRIIHKKKNMRSEFSDIITSYEDLCNKEKPADDQKLLLDKTSQNVVNDGYSRWNKSKKQITLSELKHGLSNETLANNTINKYDEALPKETYTDVCYKGSEQEQHIIELKEENFAMQNKFTNAAATVATISKKDYSFLVYPQEISIPKNIYKKGSIYKLNDCYYDHFGVFLYRVPGMVS